MKKTTSDVKITVLKCFSMKEVFPDPPVKARYSGPCPIFKEGQVFHVSYHDKEIPPKGFCPFAWDVIFGYILILMFHGDFSEWYEEHGIAIGACPDGLRPVIFKIERVEDPE